MFVAVFVDDGLLAGDDEKQCDEFLKVLEKEFKITTGDLTNYLGASILIQGDK